jgi:hypothetical protein
MLRSFLHAGLSAVVTGKERLPDYAQSRESPFMPAYVALGLEGFIQWLELLVNRIERGLTFFTLLTLDFKSPLPY